MDKPHFEPSEIESLASLLDKTSEEINTMLSSSEEVTIGSIMLFSPDTFTSDRIRDVAKEDTELAPDLCEILTKRIDSAFDDLVLVLQHYSNREPLATFEFCVRRIERSLPEEKRDDYLMKLSDRLAADDESERVAMDKFVKHMLERPEAAARNLDTYLRFLSLEDTTEELLNGKGLLLIGGGTSNIKDDLKAKGINCSVTNIEPLLKGDTASNSDNPILMNFYDVNPTEVGKFDEVWAANNSLPTYAFNPAQVRVFYVNALKMTRQGGTLRVLPVSGFADAITPAMRLNRIPTSQESLRIVELIRSRDDLFKVEDFETPELTTLFGKRTMKGASIKLIGAPQAIEEFLANLSTDQGIGA